MWNDSCGGTGIGTVSCSRRVQEIISGLLNFHSPPCEGGPSIFASSSTSPAHHAEGVRLEASIPAILQKELGATLAAFTADSFKASGDRLTKIVKREIQPLLLSTAAQYPAIHETAIMSKFAVG